MSSLRALTRRLTTLVDRPSLEGELDDEMRAHVEFEAEDLVRQGVAPDEARRQAAIAFGGVQQVKEEALERSTCQWLRDLRRDTRIAARTLARQRTFAVTAVLALGLAIAVNTTMFSVVDAMLNPPLAIRNPERLVTLRYWGITRLRLNPTASDQAIRGGGRTYDAFSAYQYAGEQAIERGSTVGLAAAVVARANLFTALDAVALEGRLAPGADAASVSSAVVISERLRARFFPDRRSAAGERLVVDGVPLTVIGVVRRSAEPWALSADLWRFVPDDQTGPASLLRLRPGETLESAERELATITARLAQAVGEPTATARIQVLPLGRQFRGKRQHVALVGATLAVLLVACTNLGNLQLVRGIGRAGELAVRSSLGATRRQIVTQLVLESAVLVMAGLLLALLLAWAGSAWVRASIPPQIAEFTIVPKPDARMVLFAMGAAVVCVAITGLAPALHVSRGDLNALIKSRAGTGAHRRHRPLYGRLVALQIGLTMPLVFTAVLLARQTWEFRHEDYYLNQLGFDPRPMIAASLVVKQDSLPGRTTDLAGVMNDLVRRVRAIPGVASAAASTQARTQDNAVTIDGPDGALRQVPAPMFHYTLVTPGYFATYDQPLIKGRDFAEGMHDRPRVVVDEFTASFLWPYADPVGRRLKLGPAHATQSWLPVAGVVGLRMTGEHRELASYTRGSRVSAVFRVVTTTDSIPAGGTRIALDVRASSDPGAVAVAMRRALRDAGTRPPIVQTMLDRRGLTGPIAAARFGAVIATTFALIALGLSALGVYGVVVQSAAERQREIGVRIALGATSRQLIRALVRDGNVFVLSGLLLGLVLTVGVGRWLGMQEVAFEGNGLLFGGIIAAIFCLVALAGLLPAYRATRLDPMQVLRAE